MRKIMLLAAVLLGLTAWLAAQTTKTESTTTTTSKTTTKHHRMKKKMLKETLGWKCRKHGTICQLDMEDILDAQSQPAHTGCDPNEAIFVNVDKGQSLAIVKKDVKHSNFTLTIEPEGGASPYPFANMPPGHPVSDWWTGPATAEPGTCYHLHVTTPEGEKGDPHIMFCSGTLCA